MTLTDSQLLLIHRVLHCLVSPCTGVKINGSTYYVGWTQEGLRKLELDQTLFMVQNPKKKGKDGQLSDWAAKAARGDRITWGIRPGQWICIHNEVIKHK